jgi:hypothetical protein
MVTIHVDRVEGEWAVVMEGEREIQIPAGWLPEGAVEGSAICMDFRLDSGSTQEMKDAASEKLERLMGTDDGGDFSL